MNETIIIYYSGRGDTEYVAKKIGKALDVPKKYILNASDIQAVDLTHCRTVILGCSTWSVNELPADFGKVLDNILGQNLRGKSIAIFGTGNQHEYPQSFVNAIGLIYDSLKEKGCHLIGKVPINGYQFTHSTARQGDVFVGLPIDEETQGNMTMKRINDWTAQLAAETSMPHLV